MGSGPCLLCGSSLVEPLETMDPVDGSELDTRGRFRIVHPAAGSSLDGAGWREPGDGSWVGSGSRLARTWGRFLVSVHIAGGDGQPDAGERVGTAQVAAQTFSSRKGGPDWEPSPIRSRTAGGPE